MKKLTIGILLLVLLVGSVTAITVGTILTQEQINNADFTIRDLNPSFETKENGNLRIDECRTDADVCYAYITVGTNVLKKQDYNNVTEELETYYEVVETTIKLPFRTTKYYEIAQATSRQEAFDTLFQDLKQRAIKEVQTEKARIESYKEDKYLAQQQELSLIVDNQNVGVIE